MTAKTVEFEGAEQNRLSAELWGMTGTPVLFLHGGGQTRGAWTSTALRLSGTGRRAIAVDLRGHGDSDWVESGAYTFTDYGADVVALARQIRERFGEMPVLVGASLGGLSALHAEMNHGPLFHSLVLVDITPRMDEQGVERIQGFMGERMEEGFESLEEAAEAIAGYLPHRKRPRSVEGLRKNLRRGKDGRFRWHWDPRFIKGERNINHKGRETMEGLIAGLPRLNLPILLVRGMQSELVHEDYAREFVSLAPRARYVDVGGAGHMVAGDRNDIFCDAILDFLAEQETA
jgi:pimeloyl-ACP methyl ester carboxylesterase